MERKRLYFGYGSNLNEDDLRGWCRRREREYPFAAEHGTAFLPDREVVFNWRSPSRECGVLNLRQSVGHAVPGRLYEPTPTGWEVLDEKEGAPRNYQRVKVTALLSSGDEVEATTYVVPDARMSADFVPPSVEYTEIVRGGLLRHGLSASALEIAARGDVPESIVGGLFVYGTLLAGEPRHRLLDSGCSLASVEPSQTPGRMFDLGDYPAMITEPGGMVEGEYVPIAEPDLLLAFLDGIEGFLGYGNRASLFRRTIVPVATRSGRRLPAWIYVFNGVPDGPPIASGSWRERGRPRVRGSREGGC